jgi:hypothetical protein
VKSQKPIRVSGTMSSLQEEEAHVSLKWITKKVLICASPISKNMWTDCSHTEGLPILSNVGKFK